MAKKNKDDVPNPNSIPNRDIIQRLNFLYQASAYLNGLGSTQPHASSSDVSARPTKVKGSDERKEEVNKISQARITQNAEEKAAESDNTRKRPVKRKASAHDLARSYVKSMKIIGQKTNVKMDPSIKRTLCKGCNTLLMPGVTAKVRVKPLPSHGHAVNYTCMNCFHSRRIPAPPTANQPDSSSPSLITKDSTGSSNIDPMREQVNTLLDTVLTEASSKDEKESVEQLHPLPKTQRKKTIQPRPLPFFARSGHVSYVGNDRVIENQEDGMT